MVFRGCGKCLEVWTEREVPDVLGLGSAWCGGAQGTACCYYSTRHLGRYLGSPSGQAGCRVCRKCPGRASSGAEIGYWRGDPVAAATLILAGDRLSLCAPRTWTRRSTSSPSFGGLVRPCVTCKCKREALNRTSSVRGMGRRCRTSPHAAMVDVVTGSMLRCCCFAVLLFCCVAVLLCSACEHMQLRRAYPNTQAGNYLPKQVVGS